LSNPVRDGVPAECLSKDLAVKFKNEEVTVPPACLGQVIPDVYRLDRGDQLNIFVEGVVENRAGPPPVHSAEPAALPPWQPPLLEPSFTVREDGTVNLPLVGTVRVAGLSLVESEQVIRQAYTTNHQILKPGEGRVMVELLRKRSFHVHVVRQEGGGAGVNPVPGPRRDLTIALELPAYENDVLNALTRTGGLPGSDAVNEIVVQRRQTVVTGVTQAAAQLPQPKESRPGLQTIVVPLRMPPGAPLPFQADDVILHEGDVVFIQPRELEVFYAGGLLPPGEYLLPRDRNLDVVEAIALIKGPLLNGGLNQSNLSGQVVGVGIGNPSPSRVSILRRTSNCEQTNIRVDLNQALRDPSVRVVIQPGDIIILQESPCEAVARWFTQMFRFGLADQVNRASFTGAAAASLP
jgi:protein involved in polysaccharide export with SLBB domain